MNLHSILNDIIRPALAELPAKMQGEKAEVMLLSIGLQESRFIYRKQINGPAKGFWQFELAGVRGVLNHPASRPYMLKLCSVYSANDRLAVVNQLELDDNFACQLARLLLWTDPRPLPVLGEVMDAWNYYVRNWQPGKPHRKTWGELYAQAVKTVQEPALSTPVISLAFLAAFLTGAGLGYKWRDNTARLAASEEQQRYTQALNQAPEHARTREQTLINQLSEIAMPTNKPSSRRTLYKPIYLTALAVPAMATVRRRQVAPVPNYRPRQPR